MEIDFRTPREALIYEIGLKAGIIQREKELQKKRQTRRPVTDTTPRRQSLITRLQQNIDFTINVIKGL